jgi:hypothetical protein
MSTVEYSNRLQRKSQLARHTIHPRVFFAKSLSQRLSRLESLTACGLSGGSERGNISDDARNLPSQSHARSLSQFNPNEQHFSDCKELLSSSSEAP